MRWNENLEGPAFDIAATNHTPLRVVAGPGTGKTFALMRRVARLLEEGWDPTRILVATFTRTAARDLQQEIKGLGVNGVENVQAGTLHSFCFRLLGQERVFTQTQRIPRPLLAFEEKFLLQDLAGRGFGGIRHCTKRLAACNAAWARLQTDEPGWPTDSVDRAFQVELEDWMRFHGAMLVGELVPVSLAYLRDNPLSDTASALEHVIVDEYQDLNRAEQELLDLLAQHGTLTVVGDEDQSIYSFKHAHPEGIANFGETHPETQDKALSACRRCPRLVVQMANNLIANNQARQPRDLQVMPGCDDGEVHVVQWATMDAEAEGLARFVRSRIANGDVEAGRVLVLAPGRQFGYAIRNALNVLGVPAHSFFHEQALDGDPKKRSGWAAQEAFTLLTLLADPHDDVALRCWCGFGSATLRSNAWGRLREHCREHSLSPWLVLEKLTTGDLAIPYTTGLVDRFQTLQKKIDDLKDLPTKDLADSLFPAGENWAEPLRAMVNGFEEDEATVPKMRESLRIAISQPELPLDVDFVRVMSLHKSKGLSADLVAVAGCSQGLVPYIKTDGSQADRERCLEEQRRLFYVVLTRTRRTLVLSCVKRLPRDLAHHMRAIVSGGNRIHAELVASQFLRELGSPRPTSVTGQTFLASQGLDKGA